MPLRTCRRFQLIVLRRADASAIAAATFSHVTPIVTFAA